MNLESKTRFRHDLPFEIIKNMLIACLFSALMGAIACTTTFLHRAVGSVQRIGPVQCTLAGEYVFGPDGSAAVVRARNAY